MSAIFSEREWVLCIASADYHGNRIEAGFTYYVEELLPADREAGCDFCGQGHTFPMVRLLGESWDLDGWCPNRFRPLRKPPEQAVARRAQILERA